MGMMASILDGVAEALRTVKKCPVLINDVGPMLKYPLWRIKILDDVEIERLVQERFQYSMDLDLWYLLNERGEIHDVQAEIIDLTDRLFSHLSLSKQTEPKSWEAKCTIASLTGCCTFS
ncbi:MAG: hypothetical protein ACLVLA_12815 [Acidaminococcus intestini]